MSTPLVLSMHLNGDDHGRRAAGGARAIAWKGQRARADVERRDVCDFVEYEHFCDRLDGQSLLVVCDYGGMARRARRLASTHQPFPCPCGPPQPAGREP
jgi:hypothetical protein